MVFYYLDLFLYYYPNQARGRSLVFIINYI
jgi:hypothetical protein